MMELVNALDSRFPQAIDKAVLAATDGFEDGLRTAEMRVAAGGAGKVLKKAVMAGVSAVPLEGGVRIELGAEFPEAAEWARRRAATLIVEVGGETKAAVRRIIQRQFGGTATSRDTAVLIRDVIGLTERQADAVANLRERLVEKGLDRKVIRARATRYADKLLRDRAKNIARTETMRAVNEGQRLMWHEAQRQGLLDHSTRQVWITTHDERTCPICGPLDGETVKLDESFSGGFVAPPAHPRCRCTVALVPGTAAPR